MSLPLPRNVFALAAKHRHAGPHKTGARGGTRNLQRELLDAEAREAEAELEASVDAALDSDLEEALAIDARHEPCYRKA